MPPLSPPPFTLSPSPPPTAGKTPVPRTPAVRGLTPALPATASPAWVTYFAGRLEEGGGGNPWGPGSVPPPPYSPTPRDPGVPIPLRRPHRGQRPPDPTPSHGVGKVTGSRFPNGGHPSRVGGCVCVSPPLSPSGPRGHCGLGARWDTTRGTPTLAPAAPLLIGASLWRVNHWHRVNSPACARSCRGCRQGKGGAQGVAGGEPGPGMVGICWRGGAPCPGMGDDAVVPGLWDAAGSTVLRDAGCCGIHGATRCRMPWDPWC